MNFKQAVAALDARTNYESSGRLVSPTLERIQALLDMLAQPQESFRALHVTGTNGKTTTVRAAAESLRASGLRTATYTSPHVQTVRERFTYDGATISEQDFTEAWRELSPYLEHFDRQGQRITWFEAATALAFVWFADRAVDAAVVEVGMGGIWDATNVVDGEIAVITPISRDHTHVLGDSVEQIATEKAGIIKPGAVVVSAHQQPEVEKVLRARADEVGALFTLEGDEFALEQTRLALAGQVCTVRLGADRYDDLFLPMFGEHAARDALLGAAAARAFLGDRSIDQEVLAQAFGQVHVPGRMEVAHRAPLVVLDGAHNPAAAGALARAMPSSFSYERLWLVVSVMEDKDLRGVLEPLAALANHSIATRNTSPRAADPERLAEELRSFGHDPEIAQNVADAISLAIDRAGEHDAVLVSGSLYTVGEARSILIRENLDAD